MGLSPSFHPSRNMSELRKEQRTTAFLKPQTRGLPNRGRVVFQTDNQGGYFWVRSTELERLDDEDFDEGGTRLWIRRSCNSGRLIWSGRRGSSSSIAREVKNFGSTSERVRRRTCVGASSGESSGEDGGDSARMLLPPLMRDDVMDLNHELRFADLWKSTNERQSDMVVRRTRRWECVRV